MPALRTWPSLPYSRTVATRTIQTEEGMPLTRELSGPGSRAAAAMLDMLVVLALFTIASIVLNLVASFDPTNVTDFFTGILVGLGLGMPVVYHIAYGYLRRPTPGKRLMGLEVVDESGSPATPVQHMIRSVFLPVELIPMPIPVGLMVLFVQPEARRLGDLAAGTMVLRADALPEDTTGASRRFGKLRSKRKRRRKRRGALGQAPRVRPDETIAEQLTPARLARLAGADQEYLGDLLDRDGLRGKVRVDLFERSANYFADRLGFTEVPQGVDADEEQRDEVFLATLGQAVGASRS